MIYLALSMCAVLGLLLVLSSPKKVPAKSKVKADPEQHDFDVAIVGAGLSGISSAMELRRNCPNKSFVILEARGALGGTWDFFCYPGIRSDSDMYTLGFSSRIWADPKPIADGPSIRQYIQDTADDYDLNQHIRCNRRVVSAAWDSNTCKWTLTVEHQPDGMEKSTVETITASFLHSTTGYYNYQNPYQPEFPGCEDFEGEVIHPQKWRRDLDYKDKKIVIIGSGATAITLLPSLADKAEHVTMLQRSPTYIVGMPQKSRVRDFLQKWLPASTAYLIIRWINITFGRLFYAWCRAYPERATSFLLKNARKCLRGTVDVEKHFTPHYKPWDQRLCLAPDGDFFKTLRSGKASVETDHIDCFTRKGILLKSGKELPADLIITATGLQLQLFGGMKLSVDGTVVNPPDHVTYKAMMYSNVPNFAFSTGYTNASWTLKCELVSLYVTRILNHMDKMNSRKVMPVLEGKMETIDMLPLSSGYVQRGKHLLPKQGAAWPWRVHQNYPRDLYNFTFSRLEDGVLRFT